MIGQSIQPEEKCVVGSTGGVWAATSRKTGTAFRRGQASPSPTGQTKRKETSIPDDQKLRISNPPAEKEKSKTRTDPVRLKK